MERVRLSFAGFRVEFRDRDRALKQIKVLAERGTYPVYVVYGPEGCGKTALLRQAKAMLEKEFGYYVVYTNPLAGKTEEVMEFTQPIKDIVREVIRAFPEPYSRIVDVAIAIAYRVLRRYSRPRLAILMDDIFQAIGLSKAETYVKTLLNLIEYPPGDYERIVVLVTSSEGITRERIGRHNWVSMYILWNMSRNGFREFYDSLPGDKPSFEDVWRWIGGNPRYLERAYVSEWRFSDIVADLTRARNLDEWVSSLNIEHKDLLREVIEDPDTIFHRIGEKEVKKLRDELIERNLVIRIWERDEYGWFDTPPPEKDLSLGIGRYYAWQTPLHREAVRKILNNTQKPKH